MLKSTFSGLQCYNAVADNNGLFVQQLLPTKSAKSNEILRKFEVIVVQRHSTCESWKGAKCNLGANRKRISNFLLVINSNFVCMSQGTVFEILTHFVRKQLVFPIPHLFDAPSGGTPCNINVLSMAEHAKALIHNCASSLYALRVLRSHGLNDAALQTVYRAVGQCKARYCDRMSSVCPSVCL